MCGFYSVITRSPNEQGGVGLSLQGPWSVCVNSWASADFLMWGGTLFCGGCGGPPPENVENRVNFPHSGALYTQNNHPLSLFFLGAGMVCNYCYLQLLLLWFNSQRTDNDNLFGTLSSLNESKI